MSRAIPGTAKRFVPCEGIVSACESIEFHRRDDRQRTLKVRMLFSKVAGNPMRDLLLTFTGVIALMMENEMGGFTDFPQDAPSLSEGHWAGATFPLLIHDGSAWAREYHDLAHFRGSEKRHFILVSLDILLHLLADPSPDAEWVDATSR